MNAYCSRFDSRHQDRQEADKVEVWTEARSNDTLKDDPSVTPLMRAARDGETKAFKSILERGADVNAKDAYGMPPLFYAVWRGDFDMVKVLVERGANPNVIDEEGNILLVVAARKNSIKMVKYLLSKGADVNAKTEDGATVLTLLGMSGKPEMIELIKAAGGMEGGSMKAIKARANQKADTRPALLNNPSPSYTVEARRHKVTGVVTVRTLIGVDGTVKRVRIISGLPDGLSKQALIAVSKMQFNPATKDGKPVEFSQSVQIEFRLE